MTFSAVILAGGQSSRMGQDKAQMLRPDGLTQLEYTRAQIKVLNPSTILVSGSNSLPDVFKGLGPLAGIHAALETLDAGDTLLVVPCDQPKLTPEALLPLLSDTDCTAYYDSYLPCLLHVSDELKQHLRSILENHHVSEKSDLSMKCLLNFCKVQWQTPVDKKSITSANTTIDWNNIFSNED